MNKRIKLTELEEKELAEKYIFLITVKNLSKLDASRELGN